MVMEKWQETRMMVARAPLVLIQGPSLCVTKRKPNTVWYTYSML